MNEIIQSLYARKSVRAYTDRPVPAEVKRTVLAAAVQAPTAGGQQLYTILDITDQRLKDTLAETCDHQPFISTAPVVLIFCADCLRWWDAYAEAGCDPRRPGPGDLMLAVNDAVIAAQNAVGVSGLYAGDGLPHPAAAGTKESGTVRAAVHRAGERLLPSGGDTAAGNVSGTHGGAEL